MNNKALLLLDVVNDFLDPGGKLFIGREVDRVIVNIQDQLILASKSKIPVFYISDSHYPGDKEFNALGVHCLTGTVGAEIVDELKSTNGICLTKRSFSGFHGTSLDNILTKSGIDEIILCGVCSDTSILFTAYEARQLGYSITVIEDCVATTERMYHTYALRLMRDVLGVEIF